MEATLRRLEGERGIVLLRCPYCAGRLALLSEEPLVYVCSASIPQFVTAPGSRPGRFVMVPVPKIPHPGGAALFTLDELTQGVAA